MKDSLKIAFWGLGSIAARHIRNLATILKNRGMEFQIDVFRHEAKEIEDMAVKGLVENVFLEKELEKNNVVYDIIFITNPTSMHFETIKRCVPYTRHMFIEKPVFDSCDKDIAELGLKEGAVYYVACPLRYMAVLQYIKENIDFNSVYSVRAVSSSYLPEWRPGTDYRDTYSAHRNLGGGVAIDLIHEWDYLVSFFGMPRQVLYAGGTFSKLEIDSDDLAAYIGIYDDKIIELHLDYFGRRTMRECVFYMQDETVVADLADGRVKYLKSGKVVDLEEDRNHYQIRELEHFLDITEGKALNDSTVRHGLDVLRIATDYQGGQA